MNDDLTRLAVVFADVSGSTRLYERLGDTRALECIGMCLDIMRAATAEQDGRVIKTIGDEIMCVFPSASAAALAAIEMQGRISLQDAVEGQRLAIRVGLHYGPVLEKEDDVFGDCVNVAARMAGFANAGQIITTRETVDALQPAIQEQTRTIDALAVKGKQDEVAVCEILWQQTDELTAVVTRTGIRGAAAASLRIRHGATELVLGPDRKQVVLGRDASCDIVIADRKASRQHARIERRGDKFVLTDQSSNGTYLTMRGMPEIRLRREDALLQGGGTLSFGHSYESDPTEFVAFEPGSK